MKKVVQISMISSLFLLFGCMSIKNASQGEYKWKPHLQAQGGMSHGGITENTNMEDVSNATVDAFSGATNTGFSAGMHVKVPLVFNYLESGVDYMFSKQVFSYQDPANGYTGNRNIGMSQFMVPLTYNFTFLKKKRPGGLFQLKLGMMFQYNMLSLDDNGSLLPDYHVNRLSNGMILGFETTPFRLENGSRIGFYADLYRGTQIYEDFYNQSAFEMPGSSFFKAGIIYHFNTTN